MGPPNGSTSLTAEHLQIWALGEECIRHHLHIITKIAVMDIILLIQCKEVLDHGLVSGWIIPSIQQTWLDT